MLFFHTHGFRAPPPRRVRVSRLRNEISSFVTNARDSLSPSALRRSVATRNAPAAVCSQHQRSFALQCYQVEIRLLPDQGPMERPLAAPIKPTRDTTRKLFLSVSSHYKNDYSAVTCLVSKLLSSPKRLQVSIFQLAKFVSVELNTRPPTADLCAIRPSRSYRGCSGILGNRNGSTARTRRGTCSPT